MRLSELAGLDNNAQLLATSDEDGIHYIVAQRLKHILEDMMCDMCYDGMYTGVKDAVEL